mgnify:CR=1 FL=1
MCSELNLTGDSFYSTGGFTIILSMSLAAMQAMLWTN